MEKKVLLAVEKLTISFKKEKEFVPVVHGLTYHLYENEIVGIVGESGSGKSVSSLAVMGLLPPKISKISNGTIFFDGKDLTDLSDKEFQKVRGNEIAMIFQEPMSSLNPSLKCGFQVAEILERHTSLSKKEIKAEVISLFEKVKLPNPEELFNKYPHQISGGQKQRVAIARALINNPSIIMGDEPTGNLDPEISNDIVSLLQLIAKEEGTAVLMATHEMRLLEEFPARVIKVEQNKVYDDPKYLNIA